MNQPIIKYCPGTLADGFSTYSRQCLRNVFKGKSVSHILPYHSPHSDPDDDEKFIDNRKRISISGFQEKMSLILDKNKLRLTQEGEQGDYILKPIPQDIKKTDQVPANEHLTMQIARQIYNIHTADNALVFFKDGNPAYITRRFDVKEDRSKWGKEDFASLAGKTEENAGSNFKYEYSYEGVFDLLKRFSSAYRIENEKLFTMIVFNFLFSNGDAHLKNFSLLETPQGDYILSPTYDLINSRMHVDDGDFALDSGLFKDDFKSDIYKNSRHPGLADFKELAHRMEITESRLDKLFSPFLVKQAGVQDLIERSFLSIKTKREYLLHYNTRRNFLNKE
jgi:serine/threonine-protein kinase HipA